MNAADTFLRPLFENGTVIALIIGGVVLEAIVLAVVHARTGAGISPTRFIANLAAGGALLLALRAALIGASWIWVAGFLFASLVAHLVDLRIRWVRIKSGRPPAAARGDVPSYSAR